MRSDGEDSKHHVDGMKSWPRGGMSDFSSELGCPVMQDRPAGESSCTVRAFLPCWALAPGAGGGGGG